MRVSSFPPLCEYITKGWLLFLLHCGRYYTLCIKCFLTYCLVHIRSTFLHVQCFCPHALHSLSTDYFIIPFTVLVILLNDKNRTIFNLKYCKSFHILVLGKRIEILYYFKPFDTKIIIRQVDYFLFLLAVSSKYNFFHLFLIAVVNLVRKQLLRFYGD